MYRYTMEKESETLADCMISMDCTIERLAELFQMSKSTVHRRVSITLKNVDEVKWKECKKIMKKHKTIAALNASSKRNLKRACK